MSNLSPFVVRELPFVAVLQNSSAPRPVGLIWLYLADAFDNKIVLVRRLAPPSEGINCRVSSAMLPCVIHLKVEYAWFPRTKTYISVLL